MFIRFLHPEVYQGSTKAGRYFEGWYFKLVSRDGTQAVSLIPGVSLHPEDGHAFIQAAGTCFDPAYIRFPLPSFTACRRALELKVADNLFTDKLIVMNIDEPGLKADGAVKFIDAVSFPKATLMPGIMGPFTYMPFLECRHAVVNLHQKLAGTLKINGRLIDFYGGTGYIEKDWGTSFPRSWVWLQGNAFAGTDASFMVSVARIPFLGCSFTGCIAFVYIHGSYYPIATYNGGRVSRYSVTDKEILLVLENRSCRLTVSVKRAQGNRLFAPQGGQMKRTLEETLLTCAQVTLENRGGCIIFKGKTECASYETGGEDFIKLRD